MVVCGRCGIVEDLAAVVLVAGLAKPLQAADLPSRLLLDSVVCLLRSLVVGMAMHCHALSPRHTRSVSSLLHHILKFGTKTGTVFIPFHSAIFGLTLMCTLTRSVHPIAYSLTPSLPHSLTHSLPHSLTHSQMNRPRVKWRLSSMTRG